VTGQQERTWFIATALTFGASLMSCSSGNRFTVNSAIYLRDGQNLVARGGGCAYVTLPGSGGADNAGPRTGDFSEAEGPDGDAYLVQVFSDQSLLSSRRYDEAMLTSERVDEFSVTTHAGANYTLKYWGGPCALGADGSIE
jgi:hypothetical protein